MAKTVEEFRLQYDRLFPGAYRKYHWDNEGEVEGKEFPTTPSVSPTCQSISMRLIL
jgi:hypothetical protein